MEDTPWQTVDVQCVNETSKSLVRSPQSDPVLRQCSEPTQYFPGTPNSGQRFDISRLQALSPDQASAFLFFDIGLPDSELVVWIWMLPKASALEVKACLSRDLEQFNDELLAKLELDNSQPEDLGLSAQIPWYVDDVDGKRDIMIALSCNSGWIDSRQSLQDYWKKSSPLVTVHLRDPVWHQAAPEPIANHNPLRPVTQPLFKIAGGLAHSVGQPVHESMTLAALLAAQAIPGEIDTSTTYDDVIGGLKPTVGKPDVWEFMRGVIWNDDPACELFNNFPDNNGSFALGVDWILEYGNKWNQLSQDNIIYRSHFGDLQYLHAMGSTTNEAPADTKTKIMLWMETMYRIAVGDGLKESDRIDSKLGSFFNDQSKPKGSDTFRDLLMGTTPAYHSPRIERRALGSCMHVIQDSYAIGHCRRKLQNPLSDMTEIQVYKSLLDKLNPFAKKETIKAFLRNPATFGKVHNFHCYSGQSEDRHGLYDMLPYGATLKPSDIASFKVVIGGQDAIEKCTILAKHWKNKDPWAVVQPWLDAEVFPLSQHATGSNTLVDEGLGQELDG